MHAYSVLGSQSERSECVFEDAIVLGPSKIIARWPNLSLSVLPLHLLGRKIIPENYCSYRNLPENVSACVGQECTGRCFVQGDRKSVV